MGFDAIKEIDAPLEISHCCADAKVRLGMSGQILRRENKAQFAKHLALHHLCKTSKCGRRFPA